MADIDCTFSNVTDAEVRAANWAIADWNEKHPNDQVANANELVAAIILNEHLPNWTIREAEETRSTAVIAWRDATDAQRAAALAALTGE